MIDLLDEQIHPILHWANTRQFDDLHYESRYNYNVHLLYIFKGRGQAILDERSVDLEPGLLMLVGPQVRNAIHTPPASRVEICSLRFSWCPFDGQKASFSGKWVAHKNEEFLKFADPEMKPKSLLEWPYVKVIPKEERKTLENIFKELGMLYKGPMFPHRDLKLRSLLQQVIYQVLLLESKHSPQGGHLFYRFVEYMKLNFSRQLRRKDVALALAMSESHLAAILRETWGVHFSEYLEGLRLESARELVLYTRMSISEIANSVGYLDSSYFILRYRKKFGSSPSKERNGMNGNVKGA